MYGFMQLDRFSRTPPRSLEDLRWHGALGHTSSKRGPYAMKVNQGLALSPMGLKYL